MKDLPLIPVPFAPDQVRDRNEKLDAPDGHTERCLFCERPMNPARIAYFVEMTTDCEIVPVGTTVSDSQGCFPVGTSCKSLVPEAYRITKKKEPSLWEMLRAKAS
jgi:hypothetical protein